MPLNNVKFVCSCGLAEQLPDTDKKEIVFAGRSNVGKSSLINCLCNQKKLARISSAPGKTATINYYDAADFWLVDLPGYGYAKVSQAESKRWQTLIEGYFDKNSEKISLVVQLIDARHEPSELDMVMLDFLERREIRYIAVLTKCDKLTKTERKNIIEVFSEYLRFCLPEKIVAVSAQDREGTGELLQILLDYVR